jgi:uncharacterized protein DUF4352
MRSPARYHERTLPARLYEIIQASLATRFRSLQDSIAADDITRAAEYMAYLVTSELASGRQVDTARLLAAIDSAPEISENPDRVIKALVTTRITRIELSNTIAFTHQQFEEHFRVGWLLHSWEAMGIQDLLTNPQWGEATIIGLRSGPEELYSALTMEAGRILQRDLDDAIGIVSSVPDLLQIPPTEALPAPTQFFGWPPASLHVLQLLAAGLDDRPPLTADITESIDRLVVSAFVSGMLLDKKRAIDVAANASPEVAQWIAVVVIAVAASSGSGSGTGSNTGTASSGGSSGQAPQNVGSTAAGIGDKVRDGKFQFVITSISHAKSVGDTSVGLGDTAQGRYTILHITVTNIGSESQTLDDGSQYVYDASGRKFSASSSADLDLAGSNGQNSTWLEDINPGNTVHGRIAFDLPKGDKAVKAELHDSMFSGGVTVSLAR